jgi:hypothetical protein
MPIKTMVWLLCLGLHIYQSMILRENGITSTWIVLALLLDSGYLFSTGSATLDALLNLLIYVVDVVLGFIYNLLAVPVDIVMVFAGDEIDRFFVRLGLEAGSFTVAMIYLAVLIGSAFLPDSSDHANP